MEKRIDRILQKPIKLFLLKKSSKEKYTMRMGKKGQFMNNFTPSSLFQTNPGEASSLNDAKEDMF